MSLLKITRVESIVIFCLSLIIFSINDGMHFVCSCVEQFHTLINYNYFDRNKSKILDIAKNQNFHHYKDDDDISIVYVGRKARMAYVYQIRNILFKRKELLMLVFDDGTCSFWERSQVPSSLGWDFLDYIIDFADHESKIKNGNLSNIKLSNFNEPDEYYYYRFRKKCLKSWMA